ncbi:MAG: hypothetical protein R3E97_02830 [Candidatus Eisenbacteria bacterium]
MGRDGEETRLGFVRSLRRELGHLEFAGTLSDTVFHLIPRPLQLQLGQLLLREVDDRAHGSHRVTLGAFPFEEGPRPGPHPPHLALGQEVPVLDLVETFPIGVMGPFDGRHDSTTIVRVEDLDDLAEPERLRRVPLPHVEEFR